MPNFVYLTLDTTSPANPSLSILGGATFATAQLVDLTIGTTDSDKSGYQMKVWGDVDTAYDTNIKATDALSTWITFNNSKQVKLSAGDGSKTVYVKIRDDVYNESSIASDGITLDTSIPTVTVTNPDVNKISKMAGKNESSFTFTVDKQFGEYKVKVVSSTGAAESTGATIGTANGSTNTSGNVGSYPAGTPITVKITGVDLETASSGDGQKVIKVFAKDMTGKWSS
ncbi:hypothetical protein J1P26_22050 [Neobacillus sp. MM2021_6]|uniref:hypothetical protein n=1 Tax=Bacillaceae TaxID=186817 RepID=UPI00140C0CB8|nr:MULTISPECIES: hypothetical protein [Bacillaceae]MBO0962388.1 hypothetical protein [Neobacillus sp. MM2021_6]NHC21043.1 hypothetical protein [Bacillus sp. MM2020_4]